jgi:hypothetical protein
MSVLNCLFNGSKLFETREEYFELSLIIFKIGSAVSSSQLVGRLCENFEDAYSLLSVGRASSYFIEYIQKKEISSIIGFTYHFIKVSQLSLKLFPFNGFTKVMVVADVVKRTIEVVVSGNNLKNLFFADSKGGKIDGCRFVLLNSSFFLSLGSLLSIITGVKPRAFNAFFATAYVISVISNNYYKSREENL